MTLHRCVYNAHTCTAVIYILCVLCMLIGHNVSFSDLETIRVYIFVKLWVLYIYDVVWIIIIWS